MGKGLRVAPTEVRGPISARGAACGCLRMSKLDIRFFFFEMIGLNKASWWGFDCTQ